MRKLRANELGKQLLCVVMLTSLVSWAGPTKKKAPVKKPPVPVASAEVTKALDERQGEVGGCVVSGEEPNTKWTEVVKVKLVLNSAGQVFSLDLGITPGNPKSEAVKQCIDKALRAGTWPKFSSPMVTAEREWTFAMQ